MNSTTIDLKVKVQTALNQHVAPAWELDAAELQVLDVEDGVARVRLQGSCAGCPATIMTLINGIEQELRKHVPEIEYLEAVP